MDLPETWEEPDNGFEAFVSETVRHRLGKYVQPDHPNRISSDVAHGLFRWVHMVLHGTREDRVWGAHGIPCCT